MSTLSDVSNLIRTAAERSNLLFGGLVTAIVGAAADYSGILGDVPRMWILTLYGAGVFCGASLGYALVAAACDPLAALLKKLKTVSDTKAIGLRSFQNLLPQHKAALVYIVAQGHQSFPVDYSFKLLEEMRHHGLLLREPATTYHANSTYYRVPDDIWKQMVALEWPKGQSLAQYAPWTERPYHRI